MRFGLIGNGRIAGRHKEAVRRIGGELELIYDPGFQCGGTAQTLDSKFFDAVDWVIVASPTEWHYEHVKRALHHGKKVICEKPYCLPWEPVIDSPDVFVVMQLRWLDELPKMAKTVRVVAARNDAYFTGWKGDPERTGGLFFDLFIHYVDLALRYRAELDLKVVAEGAQERQIGDVDLMTVDMDRAYEKMYRDIVFNGFGVRPVEVAPLHWMLARYSERFGFGKDLIGKAIRVSPNGLV